MTAPMSQRDLGLFAVVRARDAPQIVIAQGGDAGAEVPVRRREPVADGGHRRRIRAAGARAVNGGVVELRVAEEVVAVQADADAGMVGDVADGAPAAARESRTRFRSRRCAGWRGASALRSRRTTRREEAGAVRRRVRSCRLSLRGALAELVEAGDGDAFVHLEEADCAEAARQVARERRAAGVHEQDAAHLLDRPRCACGRGRAHRRGRRTRGP